MSSNTANSAEGAMGLVTFVLEGAHGHEHPTMDGFSYLAAVAQNASEKYLGALSGFVKPEVSALVLAAPDLLAALQAYVDEARSHTDQGKPGSPFAQRLAAAEAAIAKATGK